VEVSLEFLRARRDKGHVLNVNEPRALEPIEDIWTPAAQMATVGIFVLLLGTALYVCRPVLLPVAAALVIGTTLAPAVKLAARHGVPPWITAVVIGLVLLAAAATAITLLAAPVSEWIVKAPEIGAAIKQKLYVLDRPLAALRGLQEALLPSTGAAVAVEQSQLAIVTPVLAFVTPAAAQLTLFLVTLIFFLAAQMDFRRYIASFFTSRNGKLRFIRIANDVEQILASYLAVVTVINLGLGLTVAAGAWLFGFPNPIIFGVLAMVLNYIPYLGAACMTLILFGVGLVTFPSLGYAPVPPGAFVALATIEGQFITPAVVGHRLTLNPLAVLLALAFWAWLWGPIGAFLAVPLTIIVLVTLQHIFPPEESKLPG
jgi:predicted PurR-regulated permease PerM